MPQFKNAEAVVERINDFPQAAAALLETLLTEKQLEGFERDLFPAPEPEERQRALLQAERLLKRAGLPEADPVLVAISSEMVLAAIEEGPVDAQPI